VKTRKPARQRVAFRRLSGIKRQVGREYVRADHKTEIRYNWQPGDGANYIHTLAGHAHNHDGHLLTRFNGASVMNLKMCQRLIIWTTDDDWLMGDIHDVGDDKQPPTDSLYTMPEACADTGNRWVQLDDVTSGHGFPFEEYEFAASIRNGGYKRPIPLRDSVMRGHGSNLIYATRKEAYDPVD